MFECIIGGLVDESGRSRRVVAPIVGVVVAAFSLPTVSSSQSSDGRISCSGSSGFRSVRS